MIWLRSCTYHTRTAGVMRQERRRLWCRFDFLDPRAAHSPTDGSFAEGPSQPRAQAPQGFFGQWAVVVVGGVGWQRVCLLGLQLAQVEMHMYLEVLAHGRVDRAAEPRRVHAAFPRRRLWNHSHLAWMTHPAQDIHRLRPATVTVHNSGPPTASADPLLQPPDLPHRPAATTARGQYPAP
jgi:hypothetical protein